MSVDQGSWLVTITPSDLRQAEADLAAALRRGISYGRFRTLQASAISLEDTYRRQQLRMEQ